MLQGRAGRPCSATANTEPATANHLTPNYFLCTYPGNTSLCPTPYRSDQLVLPGHFGTVLCTVYYIYCTFMVRRSAYVGAARYKRSRSGFGYSSASKRSAGHRMPYSRGLARRVRTSNPPTAYGTAGSTLRLPSTVGREIPLYQPPRSALVETHAFGIQTGAFPQLFFNTSPILQHINAVPQGDGLRERDGGRIQMSRLLFRGVVSTPRPASSPDFPNILMCVIYDKAPRGVSAVLSEIFDTTGNVDPFDFQRMDTRDRFQILYRKVHSLTRPVELSPGTPFEVTSDVAEVVDFDLDLGRRQSVWTTNNSSGDIAEMKSGALYLMFVTQSQIQCQFDYHSRITFSP